MINFEIKNQNGRSMIEMLGVLAIIGVLSVGGIAGYSKAMQRYRINKAIEQITLIAGNIRSFFRGNYEDFNAANYMDIIKKAKLVPNEMWSDTAVSSSISGVSSNIINTFGGVVQIDYMPREKDDYKAFHITYTDIPDEICIELIAQDWSIAGAKAIEINRTGYTEETEIADYLLPVSIDKAINACETTRGTVPLIRFFFDINPTGEYWKTQNLQ